MLRGGRIALYRGQEGYAVYTDPDRTVERRSFTCQHCNRLTLVAPGADPADIGGLCKVCMGLVCPRCAGIDRCDPVEAKMERAERGL